MNLKEVKIDENVEGIELSNYLSNIFLGYRELLDFDKKYTFGTEIEHEYTKINNLKNEILLFDGWDYVDDSSLIWGGEAVSPILNNDVETWKNLREVCKNIEKFSEIGEKVGGHIHIGMHILGNDLNAWKNFILLWTTYENIINRFLYGEYISYRYGLINNAKPVAARLYSKLEIINKMDSVEAIIDYLNFPYCRRKGINFLNLSLIDSENYEKIVNKNTIEIRCPNGTLNPIVWQNNINFLIHLFLYAKSSSFNKDIILKRLINIKDNNVLANLVAYDQIYYEQALELSNLIFNNDMDKLYFLRQYFKSNEIKKDYNKRIKFTL